MHMRTHKHKSFSFYFKMLRDSINNIIKEVGEMTVMKMDVINAHLLPFPQKTLRSLLVLLWAKGKCA